MVVVVNVELLYRVTIIYLALSSEVVYYTDLGKLREHGNPVPTLEFKQIIHILRALYLPEDTEILQCKLNCNLDGIQLQEVHLAFTYQLRCHLVWYQCLRCTICFQVIPKPPEI